MNTSLLLNIGIILLFSGLFLLAPARRKTKKHGIVILAVLLFCEVFFCNFHSFHLLNGKYERVELSFEDAGITQEQTNNVNKAVLSFKDLDKRIGTLFFDVSLEEVPRQSGGVTAITRTDYVNVKVDASDETWAASLRSSVADGVIVYGDERSQTVVLNMSGKVQDLRVTLTAEDNTAFSINGITANSPVPFKLSAFRLLLGFALIFGVYLLINSKALASPVGNCRGRFALSVWAITAVMLCLAVVITMLYNINGSGQAFSSPAQTSGNQISQELVDAFESGQVTLLDTPSEELLTLNNPYDWGERLEAGIGYKWDHLLFEGKYYSYYGIAPVILLFLPYHLLTGYYFPTPEAVLLFGLIGITFLSLLYFELVKKFFPKLPLSVGICSLIVLQASSSVWYCFASPLFYEIAQASGFAFTCAGFYFMLKANVISRGKIKLRHVVAATFCLSCAVLCRPTLAVYCIAALIFLFAGLLKVKKEAEENGRPAGKPLALYVTAALGCFVVIGGAQMLYNYARFGNPLDFGIQYSLTINDFTRAEYHTDFVGIGFWNFLLAFPYIKPEFPFVFSNFSTLGTNGYYFIANRNAIGILWRALPSLGLLLAPTAFRCADKKRRLIPSLCTLAVCVICPLVIIFSIWESGYGVRYAADFAWQMAAGGMIVLYYLFEKKGLYDNGFARKVFNLFFVLSAVVAIIFNGGLMYDYLQKAGNLQSAFLAFEGLFEFWM